MEFFWTYLWPEIGTARNTRKLVALAAMTEAQKIACQEEEARKAADAAQRRARLWQIVCPADTTTASEAQAKLRSLARGW